MNLDSMAPLRRLDGSVRDLLILERQGCIQGGFEGQVRTQTFVVNILASISTFQRAMLELAKCPERESRFALAVSHWFRDHVFQGEFGDHCPNAIQTLLTA